MKDDYRSERFRFFCGYGEEPKNKRYIKKMAKIYMEQEPIREEKPVFHPYEEDFGIFG